MPNKDEAVDKKWMKYETGTLNKSHKYSCIQLLIEK